MTNDHAWCFFFFFFCGADMTPQQLTTLEMRKDVPNGWNGINANKRRGNNRNTKQLTTARCRSSPWHDITDGRRDAVVFPVGQCVLGKANVHPDAQPNGAGDWRTPLEYDQRRYAEAKVSGIARQQDVQLSPLLAIVWEMGKVERRGEATVGWPSEQPIRQWESTSRLIRMQTKHLHTVPFVLIRIFPSGTLNHTFKDYTQELQSIKKIVSHTLHT